MKKEKTYISPICETIEIENTVIMAGSPGKPSITGKTSSDGEGDTPSISYGGDTEDSEDYSPW